MPTLWPAGPWRFEAAVTITECNEQSVTNWLQFAQIAEYSRLTLGLPRHGTCEQMPEFCAAA